MGLFSFGKKKKEEYEEIYGQYRDSGFEFDYNNKRIGKSKPVFKEELDRIENEKYNSDSLLIKCHSCGVYMDFFQGDNEDLSGKWKCPNCGTTVKERTAYSQLGRENNEFLQKWFDDEEYEELDWSDL